MKWISIVIKVIKVITIIPKLIELAQEALLKPEKKEDEIRKD